jgi:hypothetical protein
MSFLSATLLGALIPAVAVPLLVHLLNKGFPKDFKFPSIQLIKQTMARSSRLYRWRHWILMCLRTLFLALLLLAFLRPVMQRFGGKPASVVARHVLIVIDHSASMEHRGDGRSSRERAVYEAGRLLDSLDARDAVNILLMDAAPSTCFVEFSKDYSEARRFLTRIAPGYSRWEVNAANTFAARLIPRTAQRPEIYYLSDFQRKNWANADFTPIPPAAKLFFVDTGPQRRENRAILSARWPQAQVLAGDTIPLEVKIGNFSAEPFNGRVSVQLDRQFSVDQEIAIPPWTEGTCTVPLSAGTPGAHMIEVKLPADALDCDNHYYLSFAAQEKEEVLIVTDAANERSGGAYFLRLALNPFEGQAGSLLPRLASSSELSPARLAGIRKVIFTHLSALNEAAANTVAKYLFQGGGLIYFLDGEADSQNLVALEKAIGPGTMPLRLTLHRSATNVVSGAQQVVRGDFKSRYLKLFQGEARQNLALLDFYDYYQASATGSGSVLLAYADESPAMGAVHHGLGTLLLLNFSAGELSSNLARQRLFPAWMQELVKAVSSEEPPPTSYTIGEQLFSEVWRSEMREHEFRSPMNRVVNIKRELVGERYSVSFTPDELGFYTLGAPRATHVFGVNLSPEEADLRPIEKEVLPTEFASKREAQFVAGGEEFEELAKGRPLFHWFLLAGVAALVAESAFQNLVRRKAS